MSSAANAEAVADGDCNLQSQVTLGPCSTSPVDVGDVSGAADESEQEFRNLLDEACDRSV